jgi:hypothetical protein
MWISQHCYRYSNCTDLFSTKIEFFPSWCRWFHGLFWARTHICFCLVAVLCIFSIIERRAVNGRFNDVLCASLISTWPFLVILPLGDHSIIPHRRPLPYLFPFIFRIWENPKSPATPRCMFGVKYFNWGNYRQVHKAAYPGWTKKNSALKQRYSAAIAYLEGKRDVMQI